MTNSAANAPDNSVNPQLQDIFCRIGILFCERSRMSVAERQERVRVVKSYHREIGIASAITLDD